jgi:hypothetical protein
MTWKSKIAGCFGTADKEFATHGADEERALKLLGRLCKRQIPWPRVQNAFKGYLDAELPDTDPDKKKHIQKQMMRVKARFKPWLS